MNDSFPKKEGGQAWTNPPSFPSEIVYGSPWRISCRDGYRCCCCRCWTSKGRFRLRKRSGCYRLSCRSSWTASCCCRGALRNCEAAGYFGAPRNFWVAGCCEVVRSSFAAADSGCAAACRKVLTRAAAGCVVLRFACYCSDGFLRVFAVPSSGALFARAGAPAGSPWERWVVRSAGALSGASARVLLVPLAPGPLRPAGAPAGSPWEEPEPRFAGAPP